MARLSDLPPEVRLKIYDLLLVDPNREGPRIRFTLDSRKGKTIKQSRSLCKNVKGHSTVLDRYKAFLHHLDFSDLLSLATTNKTFYTEASQTIYNNADLTLANHQWLNASKFAPALKLFRRYLERHCSLTREMLLSLVIHDRSAAMSAGDTRFVVDLINTHMPKLRVFKYHVITANIGSPELFVHEFVCNRARAGKAVLPLVSLRAGIRTTLDMPIPTDPALNDPHIYPFLCEVRQRSLEQALEAVLRLRDMRRGTREHHAWAVNSGCYLHLTQTLRADLNEGALPRVSGLDKATGCYAPL